MTTTTIAARVSAGGRTIAETWDRAGRAAFGERWGGIDQPPRLLAAAPAATAAQRPTGGGDQHAAGWDRVGRRMYGAAWKGC